MTSIWHCAYLLLFILGVRGEHNKHLYWSGQLAKYDASLILSHLYQYNIISDTIGYPDVAAGKTAKQSSVENNRLAGYAVDDALEGYTYSMTKRNEPPQWWMVDLEDDYFIETVRFFYPYQSNGK